MVGYGAAHCLASTSGHVRSIRSSSTAGTVAELARVLAERLSQVEIYGGKCACQNAEAQAFLAKLRGILTAIDRGDLG